MKLVATLVFLVLLFGFIVTFAVRHLILIFNKGAIIQNAQNKIFKTLNSKSLRVNRLVRIDEEDLDTSMFKTSEKVINIQGFFGVTEYFFYWKVEYEEQGKIKTAFVRFIKSVFNGDDLVIKDSGSNTIYAERLPLIGFTILTQKI